MLSRFHQIPERHGQTDRRIELLYRYRASVCWPTTETSDVLSHGHTVEWPVLWGRRVKSMGEGKLTPLTTPTPINRQSRNVAHTISPNMRHLVKIAAGVTSTHIAKVTTHFFLSLYAKSFYRPIAQAVETILTRDTPTDAYSRRVVPFGG